MLQGVTHSDLDVSVDKIKTTALPILLKFILVDDGLELKVVRRGKKTVLTISLVICIHFFLIGGFFANMYTPENFGG